MKNLSGLSCVVIGIVFILLFFLISPFILMVAWNFVMPAIFGLPTLNFGQALALGFVSYILLSGARSYSWRKDD